jgi:hypothetical protein
MSIHTAWQKCFTFLGQLPIIVEPSAGLLTSDAGLLPIREFDERRGLTRAWVGALHDPRHSPFVEHSFGEMVRMRVYGILADYADQNDHDVLRRDPVFKLVAGRSPADADLASQPTLSRFENAINVHSLFRLRDVLIEQFIASFSTPPVRLTFDIDVFDDPTHGSQQLTFFHGYYDQYQYLPRVITCAQNDQAVMVCLLFGTAHPALGADDDLEYLVGRLREAWPDVEIELRADSGFAVPLMYDVCERLGVWYTFGLKLNPLLKRQSEALLEQAVEAYEQTGEKQRLFEAFWYQAGSWSLPRWAIIKCEVHAQGTNRRAVLTNRPGGRVLPGACYDEYAERGESENRNKELKCGLQADRLSDHRYLANLFRLFLHTAAHNLLVRLRREVALPPPPDPPTSLPVEALAEPDRRRYFNHRRERDPLGEGHPGTWRTRLIKVAAEITVSTRRILVRLSRHWPYLGHYAQVSDAVLAAPLRPG